MADIAFECPECNQPLVIDAVSAGSQLQCPTCSQPITVPRKPRKKPINWALVAGIFICFFAVGVLIITKVFVVNQEITGRNQTKSDGYENANIRDHYTPTEFINKFGGYIASDVKDILGPPDEVSGNEWCYHKLINNPDTEKLDDVWIDFEQKPDYPIVVIQVVAIRVSGNTYTWQRPW